MFTPWRGRVGPPSSVGPKNCGLPPTITLDSVDEFWISKQRCVGKYFVYNP